VTEIAAMTEYDYVIVNDGPDRAADELEAIIEAESLAAPRERLKELRERLLAEARAVGMGLEG
jgi:guanylate kinase